MLAANRNITLNHSPVLLNMLVRWLKEDDKAEGNEGACSAK